MPRSPLITPQPHCSPCSSKTNQLLPAPGPLHEPFLLSGTLSSQLWSLLLPLPPQPLCSATSIPFLKWPQAPSTHPSHVILLRCLLIICHHLKLSFLFISYLCKNMLAGRNGSSGPVQVTRAASEVHVLEKLIRSWGQISPPPTHSYPELPKGCVNLRLFAEPASCCHPHPHRVGGDGWSREIHQDPFLKSPAFTAFSQSNTGPPVILARSNYFGALLSILII